MLDVQVKRGQDLINMEEIYSTLDMQTKNSQEYRIFQGKMI